MRSLDEEERHRPNTAHKTSVVARCRGGPHSHVHEIAYNNIKARRRTLSGPISGRTFSYRLGSVPMNCEARVLGAMLRLARRRELADEAAIGLRVSGSAREVRRSLRRLADQGLVERMHTGTARLSMAGLAVAVAMLPPSAPRRRHPRTSSRAA
jgi:hypothetical protein